jgi:hypothetical protein
MMERSMRSLSVAVVLGFGLLLACGGGGKSTTPGEVVGETGPADAVEQAEPAAEVAEPQAELPQGDEPAPAEVSEPVAEVEQPVEVGPGEVTPPDGQEQEVQPGEQVEETAPLIDVVITVREVTMEQEAPTAGVLVTLLDDDDGSPAGQSATSDAQGQVTFQLPSGSRFGLKLTKAGDLDSYVFGLPVFENSPQDVNIIPQAMVDAILGKLGVQQSPDKGLLVGNVTWENAEQQGGSIGCAEVGSTPAGQVFYFGSEGPATPEQMSSTGHDKSDFLVVNLPEGSVALTAKIGDTQVASGTGLVFKGAITFRVQVSGTFAADPTPPSCTQ